MTIVFCNREGRDRIAEGITTKKPFPPKNSYWTTYNAETIMALKEHFDLEAFPLDGLNSSALDNFSFELGQLILKAGPSKCQIGTEVLELWAFVETCQNNDETVYLEFLIDK